MKKTIHYRCTSYVLYDCQFETRTFIAQVVNKSDYQVGIIQFNIEYSRPCRLYFNYDWSVVWTRVHAFSICTYWLGYSNHSTFFFPPHFCKGHRTVFIGNLSRNICPHILHIYKQKKKKTLKWTLNDSIQDAGNMTFSDIQSNKYISETPLNVTILSKRPFDFLLWIRRVLHNTE